MDLEQPGSGGRGQTHPANTCEESVPAELQGTAGPHHSVVVVVVGLARVGVVGGGGQRGTRGRRRRATAPGRRAIAATAGLGRLGGAALGLLSDDRPGPRGISRKDK